MSDMTSLSMLARVQRTTVGESWNEFSSMYDGYVVGYLRRRGVQPQDADDIRQEVMTVVLRRIAGFEHNGRAGAFRTWMRTITSNCMRDFAKRESRGGGGGPDLNDLADELGDDTSEQSMLWNAEHDQHVVGHLLAQVSATMSEKSVVVFRRIVLEQEPADEVAADLDMTLGAARVAQHRVLKKLKELGAGLID